MSEEMEGRLRTYAERWQAAQPPPERAMTPAPARRKTGIVLAAAVIAATVGVAATAVVGGDGGGQDVRTVDGTGFVPWVNDPAPPPAPTTTAPPAPGPTSAPCRAQELRASLGATTAALGHTSQEVRLRNVGAEPCWLDGYPTVNAISDIGYLDDQAQGTFFPDPGAGEVPPDSEGLVIFEGCPMSAIRPEAIYRDVSLMLPGGGSLPVPGLELPCPPTVGRLGVADAPPRGIAEPAPPPAPGSLASLRAELAELPERVAPGSTLRFEVVLANPTPVPVALDPCPGYSILLGPSGPPVEASLNCRPARTIPPGGRVRFEMRLDVPEGAAASGMTKLSWSMSAWGGPSTGASVEIAEPAPNRAADALVGFARVPNPTTFAAVPLAPGRVHLALGPRTLVSVDPLELAGVGGWDIPATAYAEREGPFNAIRELTRTDGDLKIVVGPHRGCPGPAVSRPREAAGLTQISIQPADALDCTRWFSIDLFLDGEGRIAVVQLDLGSP